jgi:outer membrane receptor protein involved in Fe transport
VQGSQGQYSFGNGPTAVPFLQNSAVGGGSIGAGYASFLLGQVTYTNVNAPKATQMRKMNWAVYAQDNWKITRRLTLDYGLRWDFSPLGQEHHYRDAEIASTRPPAAGGAGTSSRATEGRCTASCRTYKFAFGPRLAIAYQINPKTVLRAGWGVTYSGDSAYMNGVRRWRIGDQLGNQFHRLRFCCFAIAGRIKYNWLS